MSVPWSAVMPRMLQYGDPVNGAAALNRGLVGWWKVLPQRRGGRRWMDLTLRTPGVFPTGVTPGWSGMAPPGGWGSVSFTGTARINIDALNVGTSSFTFAWWAWRTNANYVFDFMAPRFVIDFGGQTTLGNLAYYDGTAWNELGAVPASSWQHCAVVLDGGAAPAGRGYLNGQLLGSGAYVPITLASGTTTIGSAYTGSGNYGGNLDDIRLYARAVPADEVRQLYVASRTGYMRELAWQRWPVAPEDGAPAATYAPPPFQRPWRYVRRRLVA